MQTGTKAWYATQKWLGNEWDRPDFHINREVALGTATRLADDGHHVKVSEFAYNGKVSVVCEVGNESD